MTISDRARPILEAAAAWRKTCLLESGSMLSDQALWTLDNFRALDRYFVQNLDWAEGDFFQKLKGQLAPAPGAAKKLAAEMFWVMYLIVSKRAMGAETKRDQIQRVWSWSGERLDLDQPALGEVLEEGLSTPGAAYNTMRWREFRFFVTAMEDWFTLDRNQREAYLSDPWGFISWLDAREWTKGRQLRHILAYLLFPSHFDRVLTPKHKRQIVASLSQDVDESGVNSLSPVDLDRQVLTIRKQLESEHPGLEVDFYRQPFQERWDPAARPSASEQNAAAAEPRDPERDAALDEWFQEEFGDVTPWIIGAGEGGRMWTEFRDKGIAAIGPDDLGDLLEYDSRAAIHRDLVATTGRDNPKNDSLALWQFSREIGVGDLLIVKQGFRRALGYGIVTGPYRYDPDRIEYQNVLPVDWLGVDPIEVPEDGRFPTKMLTSASDSKPAVSLLHRFRTGSSEAAEEAADVEAEAYGIEQALEGLFLPQETLSSILDAISRRKNLILQGPPGVGKTFLAKRIAWTLIGAVRPEQIQQVQLHQSYAYEDFVQGWRPTEGGGFELRSGTFHAFCKRAEQNPGKVHVFLIDEINRGNLSRIFGELLMLIEADKRGEAHAIPLTYSGEGERFSVPENVYILGTMNTADRSLAMVDYALRRRFAFVGLPPAFGTQAFRDQLLEAGAELSLVDLIESRLSDLNRTIRDDTTNLGPGFQIGHSYFVPTDDETIDTKWYRGIVRTQIEPLLREYWFDRTDHVDHLLRGLEP